MKKCILMVLLISMRNLLVFGAPTAKDAEATITYYNCQLNENGYTFSYTTSNGITRYENGVLIRDPNRKSDEDEILRVNGYYLYTGEDNNLYRVDYIADENGYRTFKPIPSGDGDAPPAVTSPTPQYAPSLGTYQPPQMHSISSAALASLSGS
ncbi:larval cuticle protein 65Ag1-like isoform X1 [Harmonia axyridis]|uniref:larval cuticle protein 65Ag1-like isoform X1 n=1 Tax=Harmonia axyridis TaxID=115357 RepID=UPI001E276549|nr:larval cuticle protein 65Ag1-like isoform X1 [Harmonia axyridis]